MRSILVIMALAGFLGCESPRKSDPATAVTQKISDSDLNDLVAQAQRARDRDFKKSVKLEAVDKLEPRFDVPSDAARIDRAWLLKTLFGFDAALEERAAWLPRVARYDASSNTLSYVRSALPEDLRRDLVLAAVDGVDREAFSLPSQALTWDGLLSDRAAAMGDAAFVWTLVEGEGQGLTAEILSATPGLALKFPAVARYLEVDGAKGLETLSRRELAFAIREGLAFCGALHRSGGWSAAELAWISGPKQSGFLVRPDRWMNGEDLGTWVWPETQRPESKLVHESTVGPGVFSLWLSDVIAPAVARSIYVTWQSDAYRVFEANGGWWFEYVSLWRTPDDAQQVAELLQAGLRDRADADFTVLKNGATVAVVGAVKGLGSSDKRLAAASLLSAVTPTFEPAEKPPLSFVPTLTDLYTAGVQASALDLEQMTWSDEASHVDLDLSALSDWKVLKAEDFIARVIATQGSATILVSTEPVDPLGPAFESETFQTTVVENFKQTLAKGERVEVKRSDMPLPSTLHARLTGKVDEDVVLAFWMAKNDRVIVTFSVKASPEDFDAAFASAQTIWKTASFRSTLPAVDGDPGVIEFEVDP